jgi:hypothetical protein
MYNYKYMIGRAASTFVGVSFKMGTAKKREPWGVPLQ